MTRILITGGAGFIGFNLAKHLAQENNEVHLIDNLSRGTMDDTMKRLLAYNKHVHYFNADLTQKDFSETIGGEFDHVYHLAAINGTKYFYEKPHEVLRVNLLSTINILDWFVKSKSDKILFSSSSETYAGTMSFHNLPIPTPEEVQLCIEDVHNSRRSYAGSKIAGELLFLNYAKSHNFNTSIVRYHNIYGPRMGDEHVIPEFLIRTYKREDPFIIRGNDSRAFCYIDDAVRATEMVMNTDKSNNQIVNIGNDQEEIIMSDLAQKIFEIVNGEATLKIEQSPKGSVGRRCPNIEKLKSITNYEPQINLTEGIQRTHNYYHERFKEGKYERRN